MDASCNRMDATDSRSWLAGTVEVSAVTAADEVFARLGGCVPADLARHIEAGGLAPLLAWADALAVAGLDREPWVREAALRAVRAYANRVDELIATSSMGGSV